MLTNLHSPSFARRRAILPFIMALGLGVGACSSSSSSDAGSPADTGAADIGLDLGPSPNTDGGTTDQPRVDIPATDAAVGGPVTGPTDTHCVVDGGTNIQAVDPATCHVDAGPPQDAGADDGGVKMSDYGDTLFGSAGEDDDCKYHVSWTSTPVLQGTDVYFTVTTTYRMTRADPTVQMAGTRAEVFLSETHPAPNTAQTVTETMHGTYRVGPIRFDAAGRWTVRFHFFEDCDDSPESPHGHAAFFVNVP